MTNEELDCARVEEAWRQYNIGNTFDTVVLIAARLAREGWTPPAPVDPDIAEAEALWLECITTFDLAFAAIKRGRELERAEAKPRVVWVKYDRSAKCPTYLGAYIWIRQKHSGVILVDKAKNVSWRDITHYAVITPPEDVA